MNVPTTSLMDLVAHDSFQGAGNFGDRLWGVSMILVMVAIEAGWRSKS